MKWLLFVVLLISLFLTPSLATTCTYNTTQDTASHLRDKDGGLALLLSLCRSVRDTFFGKNIDYSLIRQHILNIYNGSHHFTKELLLETSFEYVSSTDMFLLAAFALAVAILFPLLFFSIYIYWRKCSHIKDDYEQEEHQHTLLCPQCITWSIGLISIIALIPYMVFIILLIIGTERIERSLVGSSLVVTDTLPQLVEIHEEVLRQVNDTLIVAAQETNYSMYSDLIQSFPEEVKSFINSTEIYNGISKLLEKVSYHTSNISSIHDWAQQLIQFNTVIEQGFSDSSTVISNLTELISLCSNYTNNSSLSLNSSLYINCTELVNNSTSYLPRLSPSFTSLYNITLLQHILDTTSNSTITPTLINNRLNIFNNYLNDVEYSVSQSINDQSQYYLHPLVNNMSMIAQRIKELYSPISYGWPHSQDTVEYYLGSGYLSNWNEFQFIITVAFALSLFVLIVGVVLAIGRGLVNAGSIYLYGQENTYLRASHQVALTLQRLSIWVSISGLVSAFFFVFVLCLGSLVGRTCGLHDNYTELIIDVIDNNITWGGVYPLGTVYHHNSSYPLTLNNIINSCSLNVSSIHALELENELRLPLLTVDSDYYHQYITTTSDSVSRSISVYSILDTSLYNSLEQYTNTLHWSHSILPDTLLQPYFIGFDTLQQLIDDMIYSLDEDTSLIFNQTLSHINTDLSNLMGVVSLYDNTRDDINSNSYNLMTSVGVVNNISTLLQEINDLDTLLNQRINKIHSFTLNRTLDITKRWIDFSTDAEHTLSCTTGLCYPLTDLFNQFTVLMCTNLLSGIDVYWISLFGIFIGSLICVVLLLLFASRLVDAQSLTQKNPNAFYVSITDESISQIIGVLWLILVYTVNVWFIVTIATDKQLCTGPNESCCVYCLWGFGAVFIILSFPFSVSLRIYQWIMLHRLRVYQGVRAQHVQRYWMKKINANLFYSQLGLFFLLHIPFLSIAGAYTTNKGILTVYAFFSLSVSLLGMTWFLIHILIKRNDLLEYMSLLQELLTSCCHWKDKFIPTTPTTTDVDKIPNNNTTTNNGVLNNSESPHDIHMTTTTTTSATTTEMSPIPLGPILHTMPTMLPHVIEEEEEDVFGSDDDREDIINEEGVVMPDIAPPPEVMIEEDDGGITNKRPSLWLDRRLPSEEDNEYIRTHTRYSNGVEIAHSSCRSDTTSTPRSSIYTSHESIPYYHHHSSYSHIPGYTTDDSSHKDGYDSNDSDPPYPSFVPFGSVRVDV